MANVLVIDETTAGDRSAGPMLEFLTERVTVCELIRSRVYQEVTEHNAMRALRPMLVEPAADELALNGERSAAGRRVDWERQFDLAVSAFAGNGFLIFAGDRQLLDLDEEIDVHHDTEITFLRLVPLVGG